MPSLRGDAPYARGWLRCIGVDSVSRVPLFNMLKVYGDDIAKVLEPGERPIAMGSFHTHWGGDRSRLELADHELSHREQRTLRETGKRPVQSTRFVEGVDWMGVHFNRIYFDRWLYGSVGRGQVESHGGRLWRVIRDAKQSSMDWIVTDRRLALVQRESEDPLRFGIHYSIPRPAIRGVRRRGKLFFQWGRCEVTFVDDSMTAMTLAIFDVSAARIFVRALTRNV
jgi:hypothetical protein